MFVSLPDYSTSNKPSLMNKTCPSTASASQKELRANIVRVDVIAGQRARDLAFFHNVTPLGDCQDGVEILLDEDNRGPEFAPERFQCVANMLHDRRLNALGRLVQDHQ